MTGELGGQAALEQVVVHGQYQHNGSTSDLHRQLDERLTRRLVPAGQLTRRDFLFAFMPWLAYIVVMLLLLQPW